MPIEARKTNRLISEKSPYLLQHAHNPVDWYPWGEEAFSKARREDKPIFLSIGYSTCHWCHVMERESFEKEDVAKILNDAFVAIKVDREERPDIDSIYMAACQAMTASGGWPLTIVMTPDKHPFFAGTYFPAKGTRGRPGLTDLLNRIAELWRNDKAKLIKSAKEITAALNEHLFSPNNGKTAADTLEQAHASLRDSFDSRYGGFGSAPKFPTPHNLSFLLRSRKTTGDVHCQEMVEKTLEAMYLGGLWDHIGYGFTRYSTDQRWLVPHFEKMLYDNALLAIAYLEAYQATGKTVYAEIAEQVFAYVLRDMTSPDGAFYTAEDADSEGEEGLFYLWTPSEIKEVLGEDLGSRFCRDYDISEAGNFEGKSIPNLIKTGFVTGYDEARQRLFRSREKRMRPFRDDKILTGWNGLMIAALAFGARVLGNDDYAAAAVRAVSFINARLRRADGRLLARFRDGEAALPAYLEDCAFLSWGLIELYQATFNPLYLEQALAETKDLLAHFWDETAGGFYLYAEDAESLIARPKEIYDGATPSGNSVAAVNLIRLARLTGDQELATISRQQLDAFGGAVSKWPLGHTHFLMAVWLEQTPPLEITIVGDRQSKDTEDFLRSVNSKFLPEATITLKPLDPKGEQPAHIAPYAGEMTAIAGKTTAYVCKDFACRPPVADIRQLEQLLDQ